MYCTCPVYRLTQGPGLSVRYIPSFLSILLRTEIMVGLVAPTNSTRVTRYSNEQKETMYILGLLGETKFTGIILCTLFFGFGRNVVIRWYNRTRQYKIGPGINIIRYKYPSGVS